MPDDDQFNETMRDKNEAMRKAVNHGTHKMANQVAGAFMLPWPRRPVGKHDGAKSTPKGASKAGKSSGRSASKSRGGKAKGWPFGGW